MRLTILTVALVIISAICLMPPTANAEGLVSMRLGVFYPGGDYPDKFKDGGDYGIYYTSINGTMGYEVGMHGYSVEAGGDEYGVTGLEMMLLFQSDPSLTVQSYAGIGFGVYGIYYDPSAGPEQTDDGTGAVVQFGIRSFMDSIYMGLQAKGFTNTWGGNNDMDLGGYSANLVLGMVF